MNSKATKKERGIAEDRLHNIELDNYTDEKKTSVAETPDCDKVTSPTVSNYRFGDLMVPIL